MKLLFLYPRAWRERYGDELEALLVLDVFQRLMQPFVGIQAQPVVSELLDAPAVQKSFLPAPGAAFDNSGDGLRRYTVQVSKACSSPLIGGVLAGMNSCERKPW
jgi:hypothetical protein